MDPGVVPVLLYLLMFMSLEYRWDLWLADGQQNMAKVRDFTDVTEILNQLILL